MAKSNRGFASMTPEMRQRVSSLGGRTAHEKGRAHRWSSEEASLAGRKGGLAGKGRSRKNTDSPADDQPAES